MHASAVLLNGVCFIFTGVSGCGKSTRVAQAILAGGTLVADDFLLVQECRVMAPANIAGVLALRGYGLLRLPYTQSDAPTEYIDCNKLPPVKLSAQQWQALCAMGEVLPEDWMPDKLAAQC